MHPFNKFVKKLPKENMYTKLFYKNKNPNSGSM